MSETIRAPGPLTARRGSRYHGLVIHPKIPTYIVAGRILFVTGLSFALAIGIFLLLGGYVLWGIVALLCSLPFLALMFLIERA